MNLKWTCCFCVHNQCFEHFHRLCIWWRLEGTPIWPVTLSFAQETLLITLKQSISNGLVGCALPLLLSSLPTWKFERQQQSCQWLAATEFERQQQSCQWLAATRGRRAACCGQRSRHGRANMMTAMTWRAWMLYFYLPCPSKVVEIVIFGGRSMFHTQLYKLRQSTGLNFEPNTCSVLEESSLHGRDLNQIVECLAIQEKHRAGLHVPCPNHILAAYLTCASSGVHRRLPPIFLV